MVSYNDKICVKRFQRGLFFSLFGRWLLVGYPQSGERCCQKWSGRATFDSNVPGTRPLVRRRLMDCRTYHGDAVSVIHLHKNLAREVQRDAVNRSSVLFYHWSRKPRVSQAEAEETDKLAS
jgi:hypothetical protein